MVFGPKVVNDGKTAECARRTFASAPNPPALAQLENRVRLAMVELRSQKRKEMGYATQSSKS